MNKLHSRIMLLIIPLLFGNTPDLQAQQIRIESSFEPSSITLSRQTIYKVTIRGSRQSPRGNLPSVQGLAISRNPTTSTSVSLVNGVASMRLDLSFVVKPERVGTFTIPPWNMEVGGEKHAVPASSLRVLPPSQEDLLREEAIRKQEEDLRQAVFIEINLPKDYMFEGETLLGSIDVYVWERLPLSREPSNFPRKTGDAFSQSEFRNYLKKRASPRYGKNYIVYSWPVALTAAMEGTHELSYETLVNVRVRSQRGSITGNPFFQDPFFRDPFLGFGRSQAIPVVSEKKAVQVKPLPMEGRHESFKGAIGTFTTTVEGEKERITVGDPVPVKFLVSGKGNFGVMPAPEIPSSDNFKVQPPAFSFEGDENLKHEGTQRFEYVFTPLSPGKLEIPAIPFSYFDPELESFVLASGEPTPIRVDPGETWVEPDSAPFSMDSGNKPTLARNLFQTENEPGVWMESLATTPVIKTPIFWYAQIGPLLCFAGLISWRLTQRRGDKDTRAKRVAKFRNEMKAAIRFNDPKGFFRAARGSVRENIGGLVQNERPETLSKDDMIGILNERNADQEIIEGVSDLLDASDAREFAGSMRDETSLKEWHGKIKKLLKRIRSKA